MLPENLLPENKENASFSPESTPVEGKAGENLVPPIPQINPNNNLDNNTQTSNHISNSIDYLGGDVRSDIAIPNHVNNRPQTTQDRTLINNSEQIQKTTLQNHEKRSIIKPILIAIGTMILVSAGIIVFIITPPSNFPSGEFINIKRGSTVTSVAKELVSSNIIRSDLVFKVILKILRGSNHIVMGNYKLGEPQSSLRIAYRLTNGIYETRSIKVTIPEGFTVNDIANRLANLIPDFDKDNFILLAKQNEGYLFPDTYFFFEGVTPEEVISTMRKNFDQKIAGIKNEIDTFGYSLNDIIIMASVVEREAVNSEQRKMIAGILWKRLQNDIPLQADATFYYLLGKGSLELSKNDLEIESPYNLYKNLGLPPTPIANPGLATIIDTISPATTTYWYYLSDSKGNMHYATTHDGHVENKFKYLR